MRRVSLTAITLIVLLVAAWAGPALSANSQGAGSPACEAEGVGAVSCSFVCQEGDDIRIEIENVWMGIFPVIDGRAECGGSAPHCSVKFHFCVSMMNGGGAGEGTCTASKDPAWLPGPIRVRCEAAPAVLDGTVL